MKRILLLVLCTLFISQFGFAQEVDSLKTEKKFQPGIMSEDEYKRNYKLLLWNVKTWLLEASIFVGGVRDAWSDAIDNKKYNGRYVKDFHTAISLYQEDRKNSKYWSDFVGSNSNLKEKIKTLNQYSPSFKSAFEGLVELGTLYNEYYDYALYPSGSYNDYYEKTKELEKSIKRLLYELEVRYTD